MLRKSVLDLVGSGSASDPKRTGPSTMVEKVETEPFSKASWKENINKCNMKTVNVDNMTIKKIITYYLQCCPMQNVHMIFETGLARGGILRHRGGGFGLVSIAVV